MRGFFHGKIFQPRQSTLLFFILVPHTRKEEDSLLLHLSCFAGCVGDEPRGALVGLLGWGLGALLPGGVREIANLCSMRTC